MNSTSGNEQVREGEAPAEPNANTNSTTAQRELRPPNSRTPSGNYLRPRVYIGEPHVVQDYFRGTRSPLTHRPAARHLAGVAAGIALFQPAPAPQEL